MSTPAPPWQSWAPPLDPPTPGGLPADQAEAIADQWWAVDPHMCAALQWEAYAATLPPTQSVSQVTTGAQAVSYAPAAPSGEYGLALSRAQWHRSFITGDLLSVPLVSTLPGQPELPLDWWARNLDEPL